MNIKNILFIMLATNFMINSEAAKGPQKSGSKFSCSNVNSLKYHVRKDMPVVTIHNTNTGTEKTTFSIKTAQEIEKKDNEDKKNKKNIEPFFRNPCWDSFEIEGWYNVNFNEGDKDFIIEVKGDAGPWEAKRFCNNLEILEEIKKFIEKQRNETIISDQ